MSLSKLALATATLSLIAAPVAAQAAPVARAAEPVAEASDLDGGEWLNAIIIIVIAAIGMGALLLTDDDPASP